MAVLFDTGIFSVIGTASEILVGANLYWYAAGTSTPVPTYTDPGLTTPNPNPVPTSADGRFPAIWLAEGQYKYVLKSAAGITLMSRDNVAIIDLIPIAGVVNIASGAPIGLFSAAHLLTIPTSIKTVTTTGYSVAGKGGATYVYDASVAINTTTTFVSANGRGFRLVTEGGVDVMACGALGDGVTDDQPAFQAAHDILSPSGSSIGGKITIPASLTGYYLGSAWRISKRVTIEGTNAGDQPDTSASSLLFANNIDGIRLYSVIDSGLGSGADYTQLRNLNLHPKAAGSTVGNGIHATCIVKIYNCITRSFAGDGVYINGQTGGGATGISDYSSIRDCRSQANGGHGFHNQGNDSNVIHFSVCESSQNGGYGYYDNGAYGSNYTGCGSAGNAAGSFYNRNATGLGGVYLGCYIEFGTGETANLDSNAMVIGGTVGVAGKSGNEILNAANGFTFNVPAASRMVFTRDGVEYGRFDGDNIIKNFVGAIFTSGTGNLTSFDSPGILSATRSTTGASDVAQWNNPNGRVGSITTTGSATAYNTSSDYRLKDNIADMDGAEALARVMKVKPRTFTWKTDGEPHEGFIAHELAEQFPLAETGEKNATETIVGEDGKKTKAPKMQGVDASFLIAALVASVQELSAQVEVLKSKVSG